MTDVRSAGLMAGYAVGVALVATTGGARDALPMLLAGSTCMALFGLALYADARLTSGAVLLLALGARLALLPWLPGLSDDAYRYLWDGWVQHQGLNPFDTTPEALGSGHHLPWYPLLNSGGFYSVYPPLSQVGFWLAMAFDLENGTVGWYAWKVLCLLAEAGTLFILRAVSPRGLVLYGLHPVPAIELVGQAHTEALMVFGLAVLVWGYRSGRARLVATGLWAAVLVKLYPVVLLPLVAPKRADVRAWAVPTLAAVALTLWYWRLPQVEHVLASLRLYTQYFEFNAGVYYAVKGLANGAGYGDVSKTLGPLLAGVFGAYCLWVYVAVRGRGHVDPFRGGLWLLCAYVLLSTTVHPWYLAGVLGLAALAGRTAWPWQWIALASLGSYARYTDGPYALAVAVCWGGGLFIYLVQRWYTRYSARS